MPIVNAEGMKGYAMKSAAEISMAVAMTAHSMGGDRDRCLQAGMDGYLGKPFKAEHLYEAVETTPAPARAAASGGGAQR